jgi:hypothetical protein
MAASLGLSYPQLRPYAGLVAHALINAQALTGERRCEKEIGDERG